MTGISAQAGGFGNPLFETLGARLTALRADLAARRERRALYNRTLAELGRLDTRELDDLGIARADIPRIARDALREA